MYAIINRLEFLVIVVSDKTKDLAQGQRHKF